MSSAPNGAEKFSSGPYSATSSSDSVSVSVANPEVEHSRDLTEAAEQTHPKTDPRQVPNKKGCTRVSSQLHFDGAHVVCTRAAALAVARGRVVPKPRCLIAGSTDTTETANPQTQRQLCNATDRGVYCRPESEESRLFSSEFGIDRGGSESRSAWVWRAAAGRGTAASSRAPCKPRVADTRVVLGSQAG